MSEFDDISAEHARTAAQIDADVGVEHVANVYAKALLGAAENAGFTQTVLDEFQSLVADVLDRSPKLEAVLASGLVSLDDKTGILDRMFQGRASPTFVHFLKVVARHGRLDCLRVIHRRFELLYDEMRGRIQVRVATAAPVGDALGTRIADALRVALGAEPVVEQVVDSGLIGGALVRVGDTVYDGSVANQLKNIRQQMIDRSVHEIQSRRDRFRYPAGN
ncbi:MAG: ATP synthase F1 subunit delta [Pirellulales bacterium]|nr:ATP synthase F1 subunit delta [Pirellulales bacterium]